MSLDVLDAMWTIFFGIIVTFSIGKLSINFILMAKLIIFCFVTIRLYSCADLLIYPDTLGSLFQLDLVNQF